MLAYTLTSNAMDKTENRERKLKTEIRKQTRKTANRERKQKTEIRKLKMKTANRKQRMKTENKKQNIDPDAD